MKSCTILILLGLLNCDFALAGKEEAARSTKERSIEELLREAKEEELITRAKINLIGERSLEELYALEEEEIRRIAKRIKKALREEKKEEARGIGERINEAFEAEEEEKVRRIEEEARRIEEWREENARRIEKGIAELREKKIHRIEEARRIEEWREENARRIEKGIAELREKKIHRIEEARRIEKLTEEALRAEEKEKVDQKEELRLKEEALRRIEKEFEASRGKINPLEEDLGIQHKKLSKIKEMIKEELMKASKRIELLDLLGPETPNLEELDDLKEVLIQKEDEVTRIEKEPEKAYYIRREHKELSHIKEVFKEELMKASERMDLFGPANPRMKKLDQLKEALRQKEESITRIEDLRVQREHFFRLKKEMDKAGYDKDLAEEALEKETNKPCERKLAIKEELRRRKAYRESLEEELRKDEQEEQLNAHMARIEEDREDQRSKAEEHVRRINERDDQKRLRDQREKEKTEIKLRTCDINIEKLLISHLQDLSKSELEVSEMSEAMGKLSLDEKSSEEEDKELTERLARLLRERKGYRTRLEREKETPEERTTRDIEEHFKMEYKSAGDNRKHARQRKYERELRLEELLKREESRVDRIKAGLIKDFSEAADRREERVLGIANFYIKEKLLGQEYVIEKTKEGIEDLRELESSIEETCGNVEELRKKRREDLSKEIIEALKQKGREKEELTKTVLQIEENIKKDQSVIKEEEETIETIRKERNNTSRMNQDSKSFIKEFKAEMRLTKARIREEAFREAAARIEELLRKDLREEDVTKALLREEELLEALRRGDLRRETLGGARFERAIQTFREGIRGQEELRDALIEIIEAEAEHTEELMKAVRERASISKNNFYSITKKFREALQKKAPFIETQKESEERIEAWIQKAVSTAERLAEYAEERRYTQGLIERVGLNKARTIIDLPIRRSEERMHVHELTDRVILNEVCTKTEELRRDEKKSTAELKKAEERLEKIRKEEEARRLRNSIAINETTEAHREVGRVLREEEARRLLDSIAIKEMKEEHREMGRDLREKERREEELLRGERERREEIRSKKRALQDETRRLEGLLEVLRKEIREEEERIERLRKKEIKRDKLRINKSSEVILMEDRIQQLRRREASKEKAKKERRDVTELRGVEERIKIRRRAGDEKSARYWENYLRETLLTQQDPSYEKTRFEKPLEACRKQIRETEAGLEEIRKEEEALILRDSIAIKEMKEAESRRKELRAEEARIETLKEESFREIEDLGRKAAERLEKIRKAAERLEKIRKEEEALRLRNSIAIKEMTEAHREEGRVLREEEPREEVRRRVIREEEERRNN